MTIKWGDPIECNGVRPDWLRDGERCTIDQGHGQLNQDCLAQEWCWEPVQAIRLPADHPAYVALARGFTPWSGGESAPDDWDGAQPVILRNGIVMEAPVTSWRHPWNDQADCGNHDIIGCCKRVEYGAVHTGGSLSGGQPEWSRNADYVRIVPFTRAEWDAVPDYTAWAQSVGLIRPETTAERFTRETGHAITEAVEAALNWKES